MVMRKFKDGHIAGLDLTIKAPAIVLIDNDHPKTVLWSMCLLEGQKTLAEQHPDTVESMPEVKDHNDLNDWYRIQWVANWVSKRLIALRPSLVAIEGYAPGNRGRGTTGLAEVTSLVKDRLWSAGIAFKMYPPSTVKRLATSRGNATKEAMVVSCYKQTGVDFSAYHKAAEHLADAYWCAFVGRLDMLVRSGYHDRIPGLSEPYGSGKNKRPPISEWPIVIKGNR